jgi:hypothetical protein
MSRNLKFTKRTNPIGQKIETNTLLWGVLDNPKSRKTASKKVFTRLDRVFLSCGGRKAELFIDTAKTESFYASKHAKKSMSVVVVL